MKIRIIKTLAALIGVGLLSWGVIHAIQATEQQKDPGLRVYGNVDIREVDLGFRVSGKLKEVFFDEGDAIEPGDLLCTLDTKPYMEKAWKAQAELRSSKIALVNGKKQLARRRLANISSAVSEEEFENARLNYASLKSNVDAAEATLASTMTDYEDCNCYAPSSGNILTRIREPGSILSVGEPVFTLALDTPIWIRCYIDEPDLGKIAPGMEAEIYTDSGIHSVYKGHIGFISSVAEFTPKNVQSPQLRTDLVFRLRIIVDNPDEGLRQGMPVTVKLLISGANEPRPAS